MCDFNICSHNRSISLGPDYRTSDKAVQNTNDTMNPEWIQKSDNVL